MKLAVFDLDRTLAPLDQAALPDTLAGLRELERRGVTVAVCSGKPAAYLCGFLRQAGLKEPVLMGEIGACIQFGVQLPPKRSAFLPCSATARALLPALRAQMEAEIPDSIWFQPNQVVLTPFPKHPAAFEAIRQILRRMLPPDAPVDIYENPESFDIVPGGIDKGAALTYLCGLLGIPPAEAAAIGDGVNDYPMFAAAGLALGIRVRDAARVDRNFPDIAGALQYLLALCS